MPTNTSYDRTGTGARFFYQAPPNTYVYRGILQNMAHSPLVVFGFTFSRWFNGLLGGPTIWEQNVNYQNQVGGLGPNPFGPASNAASGVTHDFCQLPRCTRTGGTEQSALAIGIAAQNDVNTARINTGNLRATVTVNNTSVYLGDRRPPTMSSARPADRAWTDESANLVHTLGTTSAGDLGLGTYGIRLAGAASGNGTLRPPACTGDPNRSPCPANFATTGFSYQLNEGATTLSLTPEDIVDNQGPAQTWTERIDRSAPDIALSGSLYNGRDTTLAAGSYQLQLDVTDGAATSDATRRSGVVRVTTTIDDQQVDLYDAQCATDSCSANRQIPVDTASLAGGEHVVRIEAVDAVGRTSTSTFKFSTACCLTGASPAGTSGLLDRVRYGDVNGDGRDDLIRVDLLGSIYVALSGGTSFGAAQSWGNVPLTMLQAINVADANGDGRDDVIYRETTGNLFDLSAQRIQVKLSTGNVFAAPSTWGSWNSGLDLQIADVDGEGRADLVGRNSSTGALVVSYARASSYDAPLPAGSIPPEVPWRLADADGDDHADVVLRDGATGALVVRLSDGADFGEPVAFGSLSGSGDVVYGDADGNTAQDAIIRESSGAVRVAQSDRSSFRAARDWGDVPTGGEFAVADVDGDGQVDALVRNSLTGQITINRSTILTPVYEEDPFVPDPSANYDDTDPNPELDSDMTFVRAQSTPAPTMKLAWSDDLVLIGNRNGAPANGWNTADPIRAANAVIRMKQSGATAARLIVYWGRWVNRPAYQTAVRAAVVRLKQAKIRPFVTITGTSLSIGDDLVAGKETALDPVPSQFATLVRDVVNTLSAPVPGAGAGALDYSMWNEPNLPYTRPGAVNYYLRTAQCPNGLEASTAPLYRELYGAGRGAARNANSNVRVYIGELSEQTANGSYLSCAAAAIPGAKPVSQDTVKYLQAAVNSATVETKAEGVAWHPYNGPLNPRDEGKSIVGIGRIGYMRGAVQRLATTTNNVKLRTEGGNVPKLYITEFGYLNRPLRQGVQNSPQGPKAYLTESRRAGYYPAALRKAVQGRTSDPNLFVLYKLAENWPNPPLDPKMPPAQPFRETEDPLDPTAAYLLNVGGPAFDTGMMQEETLAVTGTRPYGVGNAGQRRQAFCAVRSYTRTAGYGVAGPRAALPDNCP